MRSACNAMESRCLRGLVFAAAVGVVPAGCGGGEDSPAPGEPRRFEFGPFTMAPQQEDSSLCVSVELDNPEPLFVNAVTLEAAAGFHHSNWFYVQHETFRGPDGIWPCAEREFSEPVASLFGGVLFAQSTQTAVETQQFPAGAVIPIPPYSKIVAGLHLLNASDATITVPLAITIDPIVREEVTVQLRPLAMEDQALVIAPHARTDIASTCDIGAMHQERFSRLPDFNIYYILPHYHALGIGMRLEALDEGETTPRVIFDNDQQIGTALGGPIDPPFAMTGSTKLRMTCKYENPRDEVVGFGIGDQEMCVMLGFTDSPHQWGGLYSSDPGTPIEDGGTTLYQHACTPFSVGKDDL
jgi:hypothetical protein